MDYNTLYQKYQALLEENRALKAIVKGLGDSQLIFASDELKRKIAEKILQAKIESQVKSCPEKEKAIVNVFY